MLKKRRKEKEWMDGGDQDKWAGRYPNPACVVCQHPSAHIKCTFQSNSKLETFDC